MWRLRVLAREFWHHCKVLTMVVEDVAHALLESLCVAGAAVAHATGTPRGIAVLGGLVAVEALVLWRMGWFN